VALILVVYSLATMVILIGLGFPSTTVNEIFQMLGENKFAGLLRLDLLTVAVYMPLFYLVFFRTLCCAKEYPSSFRIHCRIVGMRWCDTLSCHSISLLLADAQQQIRRRDR